MIMEGLLYELLWTALAIPFLIYILPTLLKYVVPLSCIDSSRNRQIREFERSVVDYKRQLSNINEMREFALYSKTKRKLNQVLKDLDTFRGQRPSYESRLIFVGAILGKFVSGYLGFMVLKRLVVLSLKYIDFL